ncbi:MAG: hypothetical protein ABI609_13445 [Acidobacteriota bacterium]
MSSARRAVVVTALLALAAGTARSAPTLDVDLATKTAHVGDPIAATLTLRADAELAGEPRFPAWDKAWGDLEVTAAGQPERVASGLFRQQLVLTPFRTGAIKLPPQTVDVPLASGTVHLTTPDDLTLEVASLLPAGDPKPEPKPPAPPAPLPVGRRFWWTAAAGAALCLAAGALVAWRRQRAQGAAPTSALPLLAPLPELLQELDALAALGPRVQSESAHTRLSLALRRFLGRSLGFNALESTTSEIRRDLQRLGSPRETSTALVEILRGCDAVKFARQESTETAAASRIGGARASAEALAAFVSPPATGAAAPVNARAAAQ